MKVLVLCTGNSCRSQMAEEFLRQSLNDTDEVISAGLEAHGINPRAVTVMEEVGLDISGHKSSLLTEYLDQEFDYVITVCDKAATNCPLFPGQAIRLHWPFDDPASATGSETEILAVFRRVRDEIRAKIKEFAAGHTSE